MVLGMNFPTDATELIHELETFRHSCLMNKEEQAFFDTQLQGEPHLWMKLVDEEVINNFYNNLENILTMGVLLYQQEDYQSLVVNALSGVHHKHQLVSAQDRLDVSKKQNKLKQYFEQAIKKLQETGELSEIVEQEDVMWIFRETGNRYLISTLLLAVMKEFFFSPYIKYVQSKICLFEYTLGFWQPFDDFIENPKGYQVFWVDMMHDLVAPNPSNRKFSKLKSE